VAGKISQLINKIVEERAKGNDTIRKTTRTKLLLKGINISLYDEKSEDNPQVISKLQLIASEMGIKL
jgi:hypothetical protein